MLLKRYKYYFFILVFVKCSINCKAQIFPSNIVWQQNFGKGTSDPNVVGPPIATGHTDFTEVLLPNYIQRNICASQFMLHFTKTNMKK